MVNRKIIYTSPFIPAEFIAAYGFIPIRISYSGDEYNEPIKIETGVCPYMRGFINYSTQIDNTSGIIITTTCDQMRRGSEFLNNNSEINYFLMNIPSSWQTLNSNNLYLQELKRLGEFLISVGGIKPNDEKLVSFMLSYERKRNELLSNHDTLSKKKKIPIVLLGETLTKENFYIFDLVSEFGGEIIVNATENGERTFPAKYNKRSIKDSPLLSLTESYFNAIPNIFKRPNDEFFNWLININKTRDILGIILLRYIWCDLWHSEVARIRECLNVPLLDIEITSNKTILRERNRIQAFMEIIKCQTSQNK